MKNDNTTLAAMLVDIENLYLAMADQYADPVELTVLILQNLRDHIREVLEASVVIGRAYAPLDFPTAQTFINDLSLLGIQPVHVLAKPEKNSADLMLSIDCMELLFGRRDIGMFIIVGGDRDYIPVAERVIQNARRVFVVCPRHAMSGDLLTIIGSENYLDAVDLIPKDQRTPMSWKKIVQRQRPAAPPPPQQTAASAAGARAGSAPTEPSHDPARESESPTPATMEEVEKLVNDAYEMDDLKSITKLILQFQKDNRINEIWLGPFFRIINQAFPYKNNAQRKELLGRLNQLGAIHIEERPRDGEGGTYAVITINWSNPLVIAMNPGA